MSVPFQLNLFAAICTATGMTLLIRPSVLLNSPIEPFLHKVTGLPSLAADPATLAPAGVAIAAIGVIYWCAIYSGDDKFARNAGTTFKLNIDLVPGKLIFSALEAYLLLFTDRASTGLFLMLVGDFGFAVWLGCTIGFGFAERGALKDLTKQKQ
jgi:hypothetical protein